ncbi:FtsH protease activity modulator HflK [Alcanivorax sp. 1008]|uniref:FtsH protease activity modulator HflK n=1 Tax=Alcanivorax sp. 1008 TaxID=2816853 RepID=UPI001DFBE778|nr:FtsH protease activity modulator HflK [Alcanivorax sp. 1008]MCC1496983.1 FtsH protease activity modulator HflK [Alcanivorax sp. 1008]
MAWNEPGGNKPRDPWGGGGDQGPPDLDEVLKNLRGKFSGLFGGKAGGNNGGGGAVVAIVLLALVLLYLFWGAFTVQQQDRAVVLSFGKYDRTLGPGLNWHWPPVETFRRVNVDQVREHSVREEMLTRDTNIVGVNLKVQYKVVDAQTYVLRVADSEAVLKHAVESALRQVVGASTMDQVLIEERERIGADVGTRLQKYLDQYNTGLLIVELILDRTAAPEAVRDAFDDVARAKEDEERFRNEAQTYANGVIPDASGRARRLREEAQAYKEQVVARSQGDAQRFEALLTEYRRAPAITRDRLYLETLEQVLGGASKVLIDTKSGNNMLYLPLDQMIRQHKESRALAEPSTSASGVAAPKSSSASERPQTGYGSRTREIR